MEALLREYLPILIFLGLAFGLVCAMLGGSYLIARQNPNSEKLSPFECGFAPFDDARGQFDVRFYAQLLKPRWMNWKNTTSRP